MKAPQNFLQVLIADDDGEDLELFRELLYELEVDTEITTTESGTHLMAILEQYEKLPPPHLIFLDINMPGKSGIECLKELRNQTKYANLPIIMLSTSQATHDIDLSYEHGANLYLSKEVFFLLPNRRKEDILRNWNRYQGRTPKEEFVVKLDAF